MASVRNFCKSIQKQFKPPNNRHHKQHRSRPSKEVEDVVNGRPRRSAAPAAIQESQN